MTRSSAFLPFSVPSIGPEEISEVVDTLRSGWLTTGPKTRLFEDKFRRYTGARQAVALNSCTAALNLALRTLGVGPGDEVITSTFTFAATGNMIALRGAKPVLVDIEPEHFTIDIRDIERKLTKRSKGIIAVHYGGHPCRMKELNALARRHKLFVIEDAAHAAGSRYDGQPIGSGENPTCFSFYAIKNMTTGEGGMITTNSERLANKIRILSLHGISKDAWKRYGQAGSWYYEITDCGDKYNMTDLQASLGLVQLKKLDSFNKTRRDYANVYTQAFNPMPEITTPSPPEKNVLHSWHLYPILLNTESLSIDRNHFIKQLQMRGIGTSVHFIPLHLHPYYRQQFGYQKGDFPVAEHIYQRLISLPLYPKMTRKDLRRVISAVKEVAQKHRKVRS